jgi:molybdopterin synthase catalytic subunit
MARHQLEILAGEACERFAIFQLVLHHRIGFVPVAEPSLFLRVSSGHRGTAFEAAQWLIQQLKARVPIWKHPVFKSNDAFSEPEARRARCQA